MSLPTTRRIGSSREPARKRQRLSSPTYDEQIMELSQDDLKAFDEIEANFFRDPQSPSKSPENCRETKSNATGTLTVQSAMNESEKENLGSKTPNPRYPKTVEMSSPSPSKLNTPSRDIGVPSIAGLPSFSSAKVAASDIASGGCSITAFSRAALNSVGSEHLSEHPRSPSPENPPERDYSSWFESRSTLPTVGFQASGLHASPPIDVPCGNIPTAGFMKASNKKWLAPSAAALAQAEERMKKIWQEEDPASVASSFVDQSNITSPSVNQILSQPTFQNTLAFASVPDSPSPASYGRPALSCSPTLPPLISSSGAGRFRRVQPFKPPRMSPSEPTSFQSPGANSSVFTSSLLNPYRPTRGTFVSNGFHHPLACASVAKPSPFDDQNQTECSTGLPRAHAKPKFVTPFKSGMKPGEPGRKRLNDVRRMQTTTVTPSNDKGIARDFEFPRSATTPSKLQDRRKVFDLSIPPNRQTLASSGLMPQSYSSDELEAMGINAAELSQISPNIALFYSFHTASPIPLEPATPSTPIILGPSAAFSELLSKGCTLATKPWVDNHWCLILWKMAGMACVNPRSERDPQRKIWCWSEIIRQLLYRYERELNGGSRPPLRRIATHDSPASLPMVLCVSNVIWPDPAITDDGRSIAPQPELEVTDGWYRLRAEVDTPLAGAIRRGVIRVGRKIAIVGARLWSERKEPKEVLECYNSTKLVLSGNSSHLAPWHAKLGIQKGVPIATLNSLNPDGGLVAFMDIVVLKVFPLAFIEFFEDEDGKRRREGPFNEKAEAAFSESWNNRREVERSKLCAKFEKRLSRYEDYAGRLEQRVGSQFQPEDGDSPPGHIDSLYEDLEEATEATSVLQRLSHSEAGWLARHIRDQISQDREKAGDEFEKELVESCPPRNVRNFRVLVVQDARTQRRPLNRVAQLTVWDALGLIHPEDKDGEAFDVGQKFRVTNLLPTQQNAWMDREAGSEVYLCTRRDSKWARMK